MAHIVADWIKETASNKPNAATAFNLPDTGYTGGYRSFDTVCATNDTVFYSATNGTAWEVGLGTFTAGSPDTLARTTLLSSSSGSAIDFSGGGDVTVEIVDPAQQIGRGYIGHQAIEPGGRLTLESGVPISTSDQTAKTTIYYTPYLHNVITLWDGARWVPTVFAEASEALGTLTADRPYDVFGYLNSGALDLEILVWTSATARATAVTLQDGRYCKSGDKTRLLLGTFYTATTTTTEDSLARRLVSNLYNQVPRRVYELGSGTQNTTSASYAEFNNGGDKCRFDLMVSNPAGQGVTAAISIAALSTVAGDICRCGLSLDASTAAAAFDLWCQTTYARYLMTQPVAMPTGLNYMTCVLQRNSGTGTVTVANPQVMGIVQC